MKWEHRCNLNWLKDRQKYLTATDVKDLVPFTKTGRPKKITDEDYIKVYSRKITNLTEDDCVSYGAAARGHILEPFAIETYNASKIIDPNKCLFPLFHWDETVIAKGSGLAFSPDATDKPEFSSVDDILAIGEIKSYSAEKHLVCGLTDKMDLEERWQVAVAMAVLPSIKVASLIFFNPSTEYKMFVKIYNRNELKDEIETVLDIEKNWLDFVSSSKVADLVNDVFWVSGDPDDELAIVKRIEEEDKLNPSGFKRVVR